MTIEIRRRLRARVADLLFEHATMGGPYATEYLSRACAIERGEAVDVNDFLETTVIRASQDVYGAGRYLDAVADLVVAVRSWPS